MIMSGASKLQNFPETTLCGKNSLSETTSQYMGTPMKTGMEIGFIVAFDNRYIIPVTV